MDACGHLPDLRGPGAQPREEGPGQPLARGTAPHPPSCPGFSLRLLTCVKELPAQGPSDPQPPARPSPLPAFLVASQLRVTPGSNILGLVQTTQLAVLRAAGLVKAKMPSFTAWLFPSSSSSSPLFLFSFLTSEMAPLVSSLVAGEGRGAGREPGLQQGLVWALVIVIFLNDSLQKNKVQR